MLAPEPTQPKNLSNIPVDNNADTRFAEYNRNHSAVDMLERLLAEQTPAAASLLEAGNLPGLDALWGVAVAGPAMPGRTSRSSSSMANDPGEVGPNSRGERIRSRPAREEDDLRRTSPSLLALTKWVCMFSPKTNAERL